LEESLQSGRCTLLCVGQCSIDTIVQDGTEIGPLLGGSALYVSTLASDLGVATGLVARVGRDYLIDELRGIGTRGVDVSSVRLEEGLSTHITLHYSGSKLDSFAVKEGVGAELSVLDVPERGARFLHVGPAPVQFTSSLAETFAAKSTVCWDPHEDFRDIPFEDLSAILRNVHILFCNARECRQLARNDHLPDAMRLLKDLGPSTVVATTGESGCCVLDRGGHHELPSIKTKKPIACYVGAGDAFQAGFLFALSNGLRNRDAAMVGASAASIKLEYVGVGTGLNVAELIDRLASHDLGATAAVRLSQNWGESGSRSQSRHI
jgi:sugar/nucleoside kinase (ribokinase family)